MQFWHRGFVLLGMLFALLAAGCASTGDPMNASERPWNAPKNWEHGLPTGLMEGR
jgi:hypothetical protein